MQDKRFVVEVMSGTQKVADRTGFDKGAALQVETMKLDEGKRYLVTGPGIRREYNSAAAAYASYRAAWKSHSIWRILPDGKRKLVFR